MKKERNEVEAELDSLEEEIAHLEREDEERKMLPATFLAQQPFEPQMILIPAGEFLMGDDLKKVYLADYYIAKTPITHAQYLHFVQSGGKCPEHWKDGKIPAGKDHHPVIMVSWENAASYCHWLSNAAQKLYRLPTEQEWERAARGIDGRKYPWGNEWRRGLCNTQETGIGDTTPVGQYSPDSDSVYGVVDMAGNVWEWTESWYDKAQDRRVVRGGSWSGLRDRALCAYRGYYPPDRPSDLDLGFRCCLVSQQE